MTGTILVTRSGDVTTITLNRPERINAFNMAMHGALRSAIAHVAEDGTRCLVITGSGRGFCAGQDLSDRVSKPGDPPPDLGESLDARYNPLIRAIKALPMPVICAVNGIAAGAGANLALACDIVIAARSASFVQSFCKVGLISDSGGTWSLPRLVGAARATALMMLGDKVSAEQAVQWGMIWDCVDDEQLLPKALAMAAQLAAQPTKGLALMKTALARSGANTLDAQLDLERDLQAEAGRTHDYSEGVRAFMEKRAPRFEGR
jgi:2-(1,2-epoxy-1,2-dihydrophenyl)acetyl-CoA isomerase